MVAVPMPPPLVPSHLRAVTRGRSPTRRMVHLRERQCLAPRPCGAIPAEPVPQALQLAMIGPCDAIPDEPVPRALPTATLDSAHRYFQDKSCIPSRMQPPQCLPMLRVLLMLLLCVFGKDFHASWMHHAREALDAANPTCNVTTLPDWQVLARSRTQTRLAMQSQSTSSERALSSGSTSLPSAFCPSSHVCPFPQRCLPNGICGKPAVQEAKNGKTYCSGHARLVDIKNVKFMGGCPFPVVASLNGVCGRNAKR